MSKPSNIYPISDGIDVRGYDTIRISDCLRNSAMAMIDNGMSIETLMSASAMIVKDKSKDIELRASSAAMIIILDQMIDDIEDAKQTKEQ